MLKGVQQIMLGTVTKSEKEARETLAKIKAAGYDGLELNGFMIRPTSFLVRALTKAAGMPTGKGGNYPWKEMLAEAGLSVISLHEDLGSIKKDPATIVAEAKAFDTDKVVITGMYRFDYSDEKALGGLISDLNESGRILAESGVGLLYHNHNIEFRKVAQGKTAYDRIIEGTDPAYVNFELDSYWPTEAGVTAAELMEKLGGRMKLWHIADRGSRVSGQAMTPILKSDCMEPGTGNMNLDLLAEKAKAAGTEAVILECHKNWVDKSPIRSIEVSAEYLNSRF